MGHKHGAAEKSNLGLMKEQIWILNMVIYGPNDVIMEGVVNVEGKTLGVSKVAEDAKLEGAELVDYLYSECGYKLGFLVSM